jgi:hypothetical protein
LSPRREDPPIIAFIKMRALPEKKHKGLGDIQHSLIEITNVQPMQTTRMQGETQ